MLKITFVFILLFLSHAFASPTKPPVFLPLNGDYALSERMEVNYLKKYEKVDGLTSAGSQRIQQLKTDGYLCSQKTALHWVCSKTLPITALPEDLTVQIQEKWKGLLVSFRSQTAVPLLAEDDGGTQIWTVSQKVFIRTSLQAEPKTWEQVNYVYNPNSTEYKSLVFLGDYRDTESPILKLVDDKSLIAQDVVDVVTGDSTLRYFVDLYISRIQ